MDRSALVGLTVATAASSLLSRTAFAQTAPKAKNVVLVYRSLRRLRTCFWKRLVDTGRAGRTQQLAVSKSQQSNHPQEGPP
jgi:hypothetical protein